MLYTFMLVFIFFTYYYYYYLCSHLCVLLFCFTQSKVNHTLLLRRSLILWKHVTPYLLFCRDFIKLLKTLLNISDIVVHVVSEQLILGVFSIFYLSSNLLTDTLLYFLFRTQNIYSSLMFDILFNLVLGLYNIWNTLYCSIARSGNSGIIWMLTYYILYK